jgi:hypothetical protein
MRSDDFRMELEGFWERVDREGDRAKDSQHALDELERCYRGLDETERQVALQAFIAWIQGTDPRRQFAALAIIDRFSIQGALPELRRLAESLETAAGPSAPYDWAKVNRIIGRLTSTAGS